MGFFRTLILIALGWWIINKALNYYFGVDKKRSMPRQPPKSSFTKSKMDAQDAEFEDMDESSPNS